MEAVYRAFDGKEFNDSDDCRVYENSTVTDMSPDDLLTVLRKFTNKHKGIYGKWFHVHDLAYAVIRKEKDTYTVTGDEMWDGSNNTTTYTIPFLMIENDSKYKEFYDDKAKEESTQKSIGMNI